MPRSLRGVSAMRLSLRREFGGGAAAGGGGATPLGLRGESAMPLSLRGKPGFADMEALRAVGAAEALGAAVDLFGNHVSIPSRPFTNGAKD